MSSIHVFAKVFKKALADVKSDSTVNEININNLKCADDTVLHESNKEKLEELVNRFNNIKVQWDNMQKIKARRKQALNALQNMRKILTCSGFCFLLCLQLLRCNLFSIAL